MKAKTIFIAYLLCLCCVPLWAEAQKSKKEPYAKKRKRAAAAYIEDLHQGALLVRLSTRYTTVEALRARGFTQRAASLENSQRKKNREIIAAFREGFDFSPVYFFPSQCSKSVRERQWDKVVFMNDSAYNDSSIHFDTQPYLIAEFANIEADTTRYFSGYYLAIDEQGLERRESYRTGPRMGFEALVIRNNDFVQIADPFPYYERTWPLLGRKPDVVVKRMNKRLHLYYNRTHPAE